MSIDFTALEDRLQRIVGPEFVVAPPEAATPYVVDGVTPPLRVRPGTQDEVAEVVTACAEAGAAMVPWGGGTAMGMGNRPERVDVLIHLDRLDRVVEFDADNLCVTVEAGMPLGRLQELVAEHQEQLPFDPPDSYRVTLGGLVAANQSGPCRLQHGTARDWVLGLRVVLPDGERIRCGGRVIKNVSGYDMNKLFIRSFGTLGIITEVTVKLLPLPAARASVIGVFPDLSGAAAAVRQVLASFLLPEALDLLDPAALLLLAPVLDLQPPGAFAVAAGLAGSQATVDRQVRDLEALFRNCGGSPSSLRDVSSVEAWMAITRVLGQVPREAGLVVCKLAVPIGLTADQMAKVHSQAADHGLLATVVAHAGSGILRMALRPVADATPEKGLGDTVQAIEALRKDAEAVTGSLVLEEAPPPVKERVDAWGKPGPSLATMRRIKEMFDPRALCSPGRFVGGI